MSGCESVGKSLVPEDVWDGMPSQWVRQIDESIAALEALNHTTEEGFLSAGSQLQDIYLRTMKISGGLTEVMHHFTSKDHNELIAKLRGIMETSSRLLNNFDETSSRAVRQLSDLLRTTEELPETLREFDRLVSQLRIMGITTRIETERLGLSNMGFEHLAQEVTTLGENISTKAKEVHASLRTIVTIVRANERNLFSLRENNKALQESVSRSMNSDMQLLSEKHEALVKVVEDVSIKSKDAVHTLDTIVGAIQFHDITRQQIEHVIDALRDVRPQSGEEISKENALPHLIVVCELQPAQLERARAEFTNAALSMISSFGTLSSTVTVMQAESREAIGFAGGDGTTFFGVVGENLQSVTRALAEGERAIRSFLEALGQIDRVVQKMRHYVEEMSEIGIEVELLALNSRVRAAKALERGAALGVIAESIQRISNTAQVNIELVVGSISTLIAATEEMKQMTMSAEIARASEATIEAMTADLENMVAVFESSGTAGTDILHRTDSLSTALGSELESLAAVVRASRKEADVVRRVEETLAAIGRDAREAAPEFVLEEVERRLEEMKERYTMHSERDIHSAYLEGRTGPAATGAAPESSIELF